MLLFRGGDGVFSRIENKYFVELEGGGRHVMITDERGRGEGAEEIEGGEKEGKPSTKKTNEKERIKKETETENEKNESHRFDVYPFFFSLTCVCECMWECVQIDSGG